MNIKLSLAVVFTALLLVACGGNGQGPGAASGGDSFTGSVLAFTATAPDDTEPTDVESLAITSPEDSEPQTIL